MIRFNRYSRIVSTNLFGCKAAGWTIFQHRFNSQSSYKSIEETLEKLPNLKKSESYFKVINDQLKRINALEHQKQKEEGDKLYDLSRNLISAMKENEQLDQDRELLLLSEIIEKFARYSFASASIAFKRLNEIDSEFSLKPESIGELIKYNPGRVKSSWELFNELVKNKPSDFLGSIVLEKLIHGDQIDIKEGATQINLDKAIKIYRILHNLEDRSLIREESKKKLAEDLISLNVAKALIPLGLSAEAVESIISSKKDTLKNSDYFYLYLSTRDCCTDNHLPSKLLLELFLPISKLQLADDEAFGKDSSNLQQLQKLAPLEVKVQLTAAEITEQFRDLIQEKGLDKPIRVKLDLIKSAGFHSKDLKKAIQYFEEFQTKVPATAPGTDYLKCITSLVFVYSAIDKNKDEFLNLAEALVPQSPKPMANNLASFVLHHSWFGDSEKAVAIYNKSLDLYMRPKEETTNAKARGMLVQSLIIGALLGDQIGLARLIKLKSVENKLLEDEYDTRINQVLKNYGDLKERIKSDDSAIRAELKKIVLGAIEEMSP
ncbi:hypothetical protein FOA43_003014 [Brettanomyces nanus]|uniref:Uncharacterized protein n=1 Tax=Eeniella nana TaxID=13502 RepID=A0A875RVM1_EENNA|nr:uncharacterized protein FOA43_003014 [Brettanomyces nanus]QPG75657.1 hypothetical protein FOA43_003014 [Brettanomyces nanus]